MKRSIHIFNRSISRWHQIKFKSSKRNKRTYSSTVLHNRIRRKYSQLNLSQDALLSKLKIDASKTIPLLTFSDMVEYARCGENVSENYKIGSSKYVRKHLELLIARIIIDFHSLPYGVSENKRVANIMQTYIDSYLAIKSLENITSIQGTNEFHPTLEKYLGCWSQAFVVPNLCVGLLEMENETNSSDKIDECPYLSQFVDRIITRRLAARVLLGHYLAMYDNKKWGILQEHCQIIDHLQYAINDALSTANKAFPNVSLPRINVSDMRKNKECNFTFLPKIIHQLIFELVKNSIRATIEYNEKTERENGDINIIVVNSKNGDITIKIADNGGGISRDEMKKIWLYSYTSSRNEHDENCNCNCNGGKSQIELLEQSENIDRKSITNNPYYIGAILHDNVPMYGLGYGLPLIKAYSNYFGGSCQIHSVHGYGTDAYLYLPTLNLSKSNVLYVDQ